MATLVSQAWKSWKSAKAAALLVVLALTVGIGSATAIYTIINTLLLKPIPFEHGERFVSVLGASFDDPRGMSSLTFPDILELQQRTRSFDVFGWFVFGNYNLTSPGQPLHINGIEVTPSLVNQLGVNPQSGRWFNDANQPVAVVSHSLWKRLGADPALVGQPVTLNGRTYTVSGIMPPGFNLPLASPYGEAHMDVWLPLDPLGRGRNRDRADCFGYARLRPGVTLAEAGAEVRSVAAEIARRDPVSHPSFTARVDGLHDLITRDFRPILLLLFAAAELLLLITCANVGGLLVARSVARARETAVRVALGARLRQLALQYFLENLLVSLPGAAGGLAFCFAVERVVVAIGGQVSARTAELAMDWRVVLFALSTALLSCAVTSAAPLWQALRTAPNEVLSDGVRASAGTRSRRLSLSLVVAEVALSFVLLALSAVLVSELYRVTRVWPGFDSDHLLTFRLTGSSERFPHSAERVAYQNRLVEALEAIPGVTGAGFVNQLPLVGCCFMTAIYRDGVPPNLSLSQKVSFLLVNPDYFRTMAIPLRRGRFLTEHDTNERLLPVVINQSTAARYWPKQDAVGAVGHFGRPDGSPFQVVGVIGDVKSNGLDNPPVDEIYLSAAVAPANPLIFVVRSSLPAATLISEVRRAIHNVDPAQPIHAEKMMSRIVEDSVALKRAASYVMTFFALAALLMAMIGVYGVVSYSVRQRTVEIGTRMALGAVPRDVLYLVVGSGLRMAAYGIAIGAVASVAATWFLVRNFEVSAGNGGEGRIQNPGVLPFLVSAALVVAVAGASSFFPAWWATLLSPMVAIRNQQEGLWKSMRSRAGRVFEGLSRAGSGSDDVPLQPETNLLTEWIDASRKAASFREVLRAALESLRANTSAQSAQLLENVSGAEFRSTASVPEQDWAAFAIPGHGLLLNRLRSYGAPLPISRGDLDVWHRWAAEYQPRHVAEVETLRKSGARLAVALRTSKEVLGVLLLGAPEGREQFSQEEKRLLRNCAEQFALMLENARLTDRVLAQEKLSRDIALAAEVQRRLLARQSLETGGAWLAAVNLPARSVGGDYYDFLDLGGHRTGIALADVAGKGVAAALIMSVVQATLRVISSEPDIPLPQLASKMNHFLYRSTGSNSYATFFYAQFDEATRQLRYVNAGHNPPYLLRVDAASMEVEELTTGGTIIGMFPKTRYEEGLVHLLPGDVLMVFTDGVTEALNPADEEFGEEKLRNLLREVVHLPVEEMSMRILQELKGWIQDAAQYDDLTFVLMKVK